MKEGTCILSFFKFNIFLFHLSYSPITEDDEGKSAQELGQELAEITETKPLLFQQICQKRRYQAGRAILFLCYVLYSRDFLILFSQHSPKKNSGIVRDSL
jgi:hypothetical protein